MKFSLVNLGCKVNRVEADTIGAALLAAGWESVETDADVAIVNTCTVTAEADRKTRKEVNRAATRNPSATIFVTGCAAAIEPDAYEALSERVRVVPKDLVAQECLELYGETYEHRASAQTFATLRLGDAFPTRVGIKVQDGCNNACTYCIVHVARGPARCTPFEECIEEVVAYAQQGVKEIVLTGIDLGAYDSGGKKLFHLVHALRMAAPHTRLRISSIEPHTIDNNFIDLLASEDGMVCRHLHMPLQSGSTHILQRMARRYSAAQYVSLVEKLRSKVPKLSLSTDIMVGFPGETEGDFQDTLNVAQLCGFSKIHCFRYSRRSATPAAEYKDQITPEIKAWRLSQLSQLAGTLRTQDAKSRVGTSERVLVESKGRGMTESYYEVDMPPSFERGSLVSCTLKECKEDNTFKL